MSDPTRPVRPIYHSDRIESKIQYRYLKNIEKKYLELHSPHLGARLVVDMHIIVHASTIVIKFIIKGLLYLQVVAKHNG